MKRTLPQSLALYCGLALLVLVIAAIKRRAPAARPRR